MGLIKGIKLASKRDFTLERLGDGAWRQVLSSLSPADRSQLESLDPASWYDFLLNVRLLRAMRQHLDGGDATLVEYGRYSVEHEMSSVHRWFMRLVRPSFAIRNMNLYWRRAHDTGHWRSWWQGPVLFAELQGYGTVDRSLCLTIVGSLTRMLQLFKGRSSPVEHPDCRADGHPACVFRARFKLHKDTPPWGRAPTKQDIPELAQELLHYPDLPALGEALKDLLAAQFHCDRMVLWVTGEGGQLRRVTAMGSQGRGAARCFVLQVAGRVIGRLEVESSPGTTARASQPRDEVLSDLVPWIAAAVDRAQETRSAPEVPPRTAHDAERRLRRAHELWSLTPRQLDVLGLVTRGKTNKEIAAELDLAEGTVELHVTHLLRKCGASGRGELASWFWSEL